MNYEFDVQLDAGEVRLPPLVLQPLVENAVTHGIDPLESGGTVVVRARRASGAGADGRTGKGADVILEVEDNGCGIGSGSARQGFGLDNVRQRLRILYGDRARVELLDAEPRGLLVRIHLPLEPVE